MTSTSSTTLLVGLISDTHGRLRPEALAALSGADVILHAGDVGGRHVLDGLSSVAPVHAVRGNVDAPDDPQLAGALALDLAGLRIHVSHGHELGSPTPERLAEAYRADVIVFGHTHRAAVARVGDTLVVNPGAAGPARFGGAVTVARLRLGGGQARAEIITVAG